MCVCVCVCVCVCGIEVSHRRFLDHRVLNYAFFWAAVQRAATRIEFSRGPLSLVFISQTLYRNIHVTHTIVWRQRWSEEGSLARSKCWKGRVEWKRKINKRIRTPNCPARILVTIPTEQPQLQSLWVFWETKSLKTTRSAGLLPPVPNSHQTRCFAWGTDGQYAKQTNLEAVRSYQHLQREVQNPVTQRLCSRQ